MAKTFCLIQNYVCLIALYNTHTHMHGVHNCPDYTQTAVKMKGSMYGALAGCGSAIRQSLQTTT